MKILVDTNILISALLFPRSKPAKALLFAARKHNIVLCDINIYELRDVLRRKAPDSLPDAEDVCYVNILSAMPYSIASFARSQ